MFMDLMNQVFH
jgi:ribonuclease HI